MQGLLQKHIKDTNWLINKPIWPFPLGLISHLLEYPWEYCTYTIHDALLISSLIHNEGCTSGSDDWCTRFHYNLQMPRNSIKRHPQPLTANQICAFSVLPAGVRWVIWTVPQIPLRHLKPFVLVPKRFQGSLHDIASDLDGSLLLLNVLWALLNVGVGYLSSK